MSENKEITKELLLDIRATLKEAFKPLVEKHGVNVSLGNVSYSPEEATGKLIIKIINDITPSEIVEKNKELFEKFAMKYGLKASWFGKEFTVDGEKFKISELNRKGRTRNIVAISTTPGKNFGKEYIFLTKSIIEKFNT